MSTAKKKTAPATAASIAKGDLARINARKQKRMLQLEPAGGGRVRPTTPPGVNPATKLPHTSRYRRGEV